MTSQERKNTTSQFERFDDAQMPADRDSEFSRLLQIRRLEVRDAPFRGFESPPGRF